MNDMKTLQQIVKKDPRYPVEAYTFVLEALFYSRKKLHIQNHVTGQQLLGGIRDLARDRYGLMAKIVFAHWGITKTIDFGNIVFNMVKAKMLGKTTEDSIDDFKDIYDFDEVFVENYPLDVRDLKNDEG
jgi:uncharacterized repeat protein (TIGR04138 family)